MKIAIIIQVHKNPKQLKRLISALNLPNIDFYVNVDKKSVLEDFYINQANVVFVKKRIDVIWARVSQVIATLNSLQEVVDSQNSYSNVIFISGQDYPIVPVENILKELRSSPKTEYINIRNVSDETTKISWGVAHRYKIFHFRNKILKKFFKKMFYSRKYPLPQVFAGASWWILSLGCVRYILDFVNSNPSFLRFHKYVICADEMFFQSIIMNSPFSKLVNSDNKRYVDWSEKKFNPKVLGVDDFKFLKESNAWFARKFDIEQDEKILSLIDNELL